MRQIAPITTLFLDIGGVLLTDGWDHHARKRAAACFKIAWPDLEERHALHFAIFEAGKLTLEDYLTRVVFHQKRPFTRAQFRRFMFAQSKPHPEMIALVRRLKAKYGLKVVVVSNEARELNAFRIRKFKLGEFVDFFVSSCYVRLSKPDADIFRLAMNISQAPIHQIAYIDNTPLFVHIAEGMGIQSVLHTDCGSTSARLAALGLETGERAKLGIR